METALVPANQLTTVDPETGALPMRLAPGAKLREDGKLFIFEKIAEGLTDEQICTLVVQQGYVLSYTQQAVNYWRSKPEVKKMVQERNLAAFQTGWASKAVRVRELSVMAEAIKNELLEDDGQGNLRMKSSVTEVTTNELTGQDVVKVKGINKQAQAMMVREFTGIVTTIGTLVDDPLNKKIDVSVEGSIEHNHKAQQLGIAGRSREEMLARLDRAKQVIATDIVIADEMPSSLAPAEDDAMDVSFSEEDEE